MDWLSFTCYVSVYKENCKVMHKVVWSYLRSHGKWERCQKFETDQRGKHVSELMATDVPMTKSNDLFIKEKE